MRYSRELRKLIYFEVYGFNPLIYGNKRYVVCDGLVLSSFRPIKVLIPYNLHEDLRGARIKKYVVLKTISNERIAISSKDTIASIYDRERLRRYTGKAATIPERIDMRLRTLPRNLPDRMLFISWTEIPSYMESICTELILLAMYYVRSRLGMKMFKFDDYGLVEKLIKKLRYNEGLLVIHDKALVFIPIPVRYIHYNDVRRALISLKIEEQEEIRKKEQLYEEQLYEEDEEYEELSPL